MKKVRLNCPRCGRRVIDSDGNVKTELREVTGSTQWQPDYYEKCKKCGAEIGIKKLNI